MRLIIPGGAGFIGANFAEKLYGDKQTLALLEKIIVVDFLQYGEQKIPPRILKYNKFQFLNISIYKKGFVNKLVRKGDVVLHLTEDENTFENPQNHFSSGFGKYLKALSVIGVSKFIFFSTADVYGVNNSNNLVETDIVRPTTIYAANKVAFEAYLQAYYSLFNFPVIILRPVTVYGPKQHPGWLIPRVITRALVGEKIQITGDGSVKRDWIFVDDLCDVLIQTLTLNKPSIYSEVFNIGTGEEKTVLEVVLYILKKLNKPQSLIEFVPPRSGEIPRQITSATKARKTFKWEPKVGFFEGLEKTINWYKKSNK